MVTVALSIASALLAVVALLLYAAGRARARALADDVRANVEPYLRRMAAGEGMPADAPTWTSRTTPEEIVTFSTRLAGRLLDRERSGPLPTTTKELEIAKTQPVSDSDELLITPVSDDSSRSSSRRGE